MKKLLSLPANLVPCFHAIENASEQEWFCASDPVGKQLGSGGGSAWLLQACRMHEAPDMPASQWLAKEKRILLHAGGQSRRLPAYAPSGKILTPIPVFRWARGQRLGQNLLSLQCPLYEEIMRRAPDSFHTLIASGDVFIRHTQPLTTPPQADVVCYGLWTDPALATRHGVFLAERERPDELDFMLQKPSMAELSKLARTHLFLMDIGIWLLSDRAVEALMKRSGAKDGKEPENYDLYAGFGRALGKRPPVEDAEVNALTVAILPLAGGEFYHYGTGRELISSTLSIQNLVHDQRTIMQRALKPHPAMFVQNARVDVTLTTDNADLWIENSHIGPRWRLANRHILTGIPANDWELNLPPGTCIDIAPCGAADWVVRPYGFDDVFKGAPDSEETLFIGQPLKQWAAERDLCLPPTADIQDTPLFPRCQTMEDIGDALRWMIAEPHYAKGKALWEAAPKLSAADLLNQTNLVRLAAQRKDFRAHNWPALAANHEKSVFYQLDLADAADEFAGERIPLPAILPPDAPLMKQIHNRMFRARTLRMEGMAYEDEQQEAFALLRDGLVEGTKDRNVVPQLNVCRDQIVWGRSPVRIDLAGGWTDTPPYCLYAGGNVVNVAIELNGQPPLQVYIKPSTARDDAITLRSIDLGAVEVITSWEELAHYNKVGSPFSIPKAALSLAGFLPAFGAGAYASLQHQLKAFGAGIEITLLSAVPAGSGLGTSSILAATVLGALSDFCGLGWDKNEIAGRSLILEQLLTTGGGWQDPFGGVLHGLKLLQTNKGFNQSPFVRWLPEYLFTEYRPCHLLYYTGITRTAKDILAEIVASMFLNSGKHLQLLADMKAHALDMYDAIQYGDFPAYGRLVKKTWEQNKAIDAGTNPPAIEALIAQIKDYTLGYKLPGAGGGGYLYMVAKDPEAAACIRRTLAQHPLNSNARFVEMQLSPHGLQISRS
ncbi:MAG: bifunctional fucokinase/L-fucose-1-P-guanylyltransferase [Tannerellaceae bacterium]|jgi:galactokinase/mevalonate kinase-like predicted kinase|nr:bifunctional fucokinase/L-fucose-1-P-guanylyltransferase [Tannerellaceae bacterium]